jgi:organic radical activating enzyme
MNNKTFCAEPWKQIFVGPDSKIKTCCAGNVELGDLRTQKIQEILEGDVLKEIKNTILRGEWHSNCTGCKLLEERGVYSQRKRTEHEVKDIEFYKNNVDYHVPELLDIRWSNICNLACNYCNSYFSSVWASIKKQYQTPTSYENLHEYIKENSDNVKIVILLGGEPFLQKDNIKLLNNLPNSVKIDILTNLSVDNLEKNDMFWVLKQKADDGALISFSFSFENVAERFEYVRHKAVWDTFVNNIKLIKHNFPTHIRKAVPLYSIYSAFNLLDLYDFIIEHELDVLWQKLEYPNVLNVSSMPLYIRKRAIEQIDKIYEKYFKQENANRLDLQTLLNIKETLYTNPEKELTLEEVFDFHKELESKYHTKTKTFEQLWNLKE